MLKRFFAITAGLMLALGLGVAGTASASTSDMVRTQQQQTVGTAFDEPNFVPAATAESLVAPTTCTTFDVISAESASLTAPVAATTQVTFFSDTNCLVPTGVVLNVLNPSNANMPAALSYTAVTA